MMIQRKTEDLENRSHPAANGARDSSLSAFFSKAPLDDSRPALIHFSSTPLFRLDACPDKYMHLLKKKDRDNIVPIVNYLIGKSGHVAYLGGDAVRNLYLRGRRKYKALNVLAILSVREVDSYSNIMNNIISSNDGEFSMGLKYRVRKNRGEGCFKDISHASYFIEPRLEGLEKLLFVFKPTTIELDITTHERFSRAFGLS